MLTPQDMVECRETILPLCSQFFPITFHVFQFQLKQIQYLQFVNSGFDKRDEFDCV